MAHGAVTCEGREGLGVDLQCGYVTENGNQLCLGEQYSRQAIEPLRVGAGRVGGCGQAIEAL